MYSCSSKQLEIDDTIFQRSDASCQSSTVYEYIYFNHKCMRSLIPHNYSHQSLDTHLYTIITIYDTVLALFQGTWKNRNLKTEMDTEMDGGHGNGLC